MKYTISIKTISATLIIITIMLIAIFQAYWLHRVYSDTRQNIERETNGIFRDVVYQAQMLRIEEDTNSFKNGIRNNKFLVNILTTLRGDSADSAVSSRRNGKPGRIILSFSAKHRGDSSAPTQILQEQIDPDDISHHSPDSLPGLPELFSEKTKLNDWLNVSSLDSAYQRNLQKVGIFMPFVIKGLPDSSDLEVINSTEEIRTSPAFIGLSQSRGYQAIFYNVFRYIINRMMLQILFSVALVLITMLSFVVLYRNLLSQRRLALMKNEFISNITHELKTPIATVHVAIEALRNFNALEDPAKTKEYLDISASELQRLSLLVDKVLKLSMFENKEIDLKKESFHLYALCAGIVESMKLQFDKANTSVIVSKQGEKFMVVADKIHIASLAYNLLDNALKYNKDRAPIELKVISHEGYIEIQVSDQGIGIPAEYQKRIFDKFFRVPDNSHHNIKGYGLGLSYVNHIAKRHLGFIEVKSEPGKGSTFFVKLPYEESDEINYDRGRVIRKTKL